MVRTKAAKGRCMLQCRHLIMSLARWIRTLPTTRRNPVCTWQCWSESFSNSDCLSLRLQQDNFVEKQETLKQIREDLEKTHKVETTSRIPGPTVLGLWPELRGFAV